MYRTLTSTLGKLDPQTTLYPGHNYADRPTSTLAQERQDNPFLQFDDAPAFVRFRMSGEYATDVSDASGTLMLDVARRRWSTHMLAQADIDAGTRSDGLTTAEREELAALRRENRRLKEDVEILKRATAFFVKETR